jgi:hypothetical protein
MTCLIITDKCHIHVTQFYRCATIAGTVVQAGLCKESTSIMRLYSGEDIDYVL